MDSPYRSLYGHLSILGIFAFLCGCSTHGEKSPPAVSSVPPTAELNVFSGLTIEQGPTSLGAEPRKEAIRFLILHHTAGSLPSSLRTLQGRDPNHKVGVHYVLTDEPKPRVIRMVPEDQSAYHAGGSSWGPTIALNQQSIGIEIINLDGNIHPYSAAQEELLFALCTDIIQRHGIKPQHVLGHSDIAVGRKIDPGSLFPWKNLAALGVGAWPLATEVKANLLRNPRLPPDEIRKLLQAYGYGFAAGEAGLKLGITAFQRHFRTSKVDGLADAETVSILQALVRRYEPSEFRKAHLRK